MTLTGAFSLRISHFRTTAEHFRCHCCKMPLLLPASILYAESYAVRIRPIFLLQFLLTVLSRPKLDPLFLGTTETRLDHQKTHVQSEARKSLIRDANDIKLMMGLVMNDRWTNLTKIADSKHSIQIRRLLRTEPWYMVQIVGFETPKNNSADFFIFTDSQKM